MRTFLIKIIILTLLLLIIILQTSSSPIPIFFNRICSTYSLYFCATPFPLITLGLNARLGPITTAATTTTNTLINGTVPTNVNVVSSPIPPAVVTTVTTLLPINNVRAATFPTVSGALRSRSYGPGSIAIQIQQLNRLAQTQPKPGPLVINMKATRLARSGG